MKRVRINVGKVGIVTRKGDYVGVLEAGKHWIRISEEVRTFDMFTLYQSDSDLAIMLKDEKFRNLVEVIEVLDNEIALKYKGENFETVLEPGKYFYWKGFAEFRFDKIDLAKVEITESIDVALLQRIELLNYIRVFKIEPYEEGLLFVDGKYSQKLTKGTYRFWKNAISVEVLKADQRQLQLEVSGQEILTKDKASLRVSFYTQYKIVDSEKALLNSKDYEKQLYTLIQLALREYIGTMSLDDLLDNKLAVTDYVKDKVSEKAAKLGLDISDAGIRDIILPGEVREIMNEVLVAQKKAQANMITRREETASTRSLLNTAKLMEDNSMLYKLKEMEYIEKIADRIGAITLSGNGKVIDQLADIFSSK